MKQSRAIPALARAVCASLVLTLAVLATSAAESNICDAEEFWEGKCHSNEDWRAGWYLHPDNDPGDGSAVDTAYANFAHVIVDMPHSMCIDWRTANCDGTIPPDPPARSDDTGPVRLKILARTLKECRLQAHLRASIDPYCRRLIAYDASLTDGDAGFNAKTLAAQRAFISSLPTARHCARSAAYIVANSADYTAGNLLEPQVAQIEADIVAVQSWSCATYHNQTPPAIPDPPTS